MALFQIWKLKKRRNEMEWVEKYSNLTEKDKIMFQDCANRLLAHSILVSKREEDKPFYRFCERHIEIFKEYFSMSGWELNNSNNRVITLKNKYGRNRIQLNLSESIMLFVLCKLYYEQSAELRLTRDVHITPLEVREQYMALQISHRLPAQEAVKRMLKMFSKHSLIDLVQGDWGSESAIITIYDSITEVMTVQIIDAIAKWINEIELERGDIEDEIIIEAGND